MNQNDVLDIVEDKTKTYSQQVLALARLAEAQDHSIDYGPEYRKAHDDNCINDLNEGVLPYRPRYICPDYALLLEKGCQFLNLEPAKDLYDACNNLLIMYHNVPSITTFPVYLGQIDDLLEPYVQALPREEAKAELRRFLRHIDSTLTDSFVHMNIGPKASLTGELVMELSVEMLTAVPNITLKYDPQVTPDDFAVKACSSMLVCAKPSFANHRMFVSDWGKDYVIASCYNGLLLGGGGYTLPRLMMHEIAQKATSVDDFMDRVLPYYVHLECDYMRKRIIFLNEKSAFFQAPSFLLKEGFIHKDRFVGMAGMVGLAEGVNQLLGITDKKKGFGNNKAAEDLGVTIMERLSKLVYDEPAPYSEATGGHFRLHAQVGINTDGTFDAPGTRIPIGCEPIMPLQLAVNERFHPYFPTGTGDIFRFDQTWAKNPQAVLDIIKGAMAKGLRYFSCYLDSGDVVRVTGYLVKKSELAKLDKGEASLNQVSLFGKGARDGGHALDRRLENDGQGQSH